MKVTIELLKLNRILKILIRYIKKILMEQTWCEMLLM